MTYRVAGPGARRPIRGCSRPPRVRRGGARARRPRVQEVPAELQHIGPHALPRAAAAGTAEGWRCWGVGCALGIGAQRIADREGTLGPEDWMCRWDRSVSASRCGGLAAMDVLAVALSCLFVDCGFIVQWILLPPSSAGGGHVGRVPRAVGSRAAGLPAQVRERRAGEDAKVCRKLLVSPASGQHVAMSRLPPHAR